MSQMSSSLVKPLGPMYVLLAVKPFYFISDPSNYRIKVMMASVMTAPSARGKIIQVKNFVTI